jgi:hypothetical protein
MTDEMRDAERAALARIIGTDRVNAAWPDDAWPVGTRVLVVKDPEWDGPWRQQFTGTIDDVMAPTPVDHPTARPGEYAYFVAFDQPQHDESDDGPYHKAQIWDRYLRPITPP